MLYFNFDIIFGFTIKFYLWIPNRSQSDSLKIMKKKKNGTFNVKLIFNYSKKDCSGVNFLSVTQKLLCGISCNL